MGFLNKKPQYTQEDSASKHQQTMDDVYDIYESFYGQTKSPEVSALLAVGTIIASTLNGRMVQLVRSVNEANGVSPDPLNRIDNRHT